MMFGFEELLCNDVMHVIKFLQRETWPRKVSDSLSSLDVAQNPGWQNFDIIWHRCEAQAEHITCYFLGTADSTGFTYVSISFQPLPAVVFFLVEHMGGSPGSGLTEVSAVRLWRQFWSVRWGTSCSAARPDFTIHNLGVIHKKWMWILFNHKNYKDKDHRQTREVLPKCCFFLKMGNLWKIGPRMDYSPWTDLQVWCPGPGICLYMCWS